MAKTKPSSTPFRDLTADEQVGRFEWYFRDAAENWEAVAAANKFLKCVDEDTEFLWELLKEDGPPGLSLTGINDARVRHIIFGLVARLHRHKLRPILASRMKIERVKKRAGEAVSLFKEMSLGSNRSFSATVREVADRLSENTSKPVNEKTVRGYLKSHGISANKNRSGKTSV